MPRRAWLCLLLLCGSLSISALAAEGILRLLGYHGAPFSRISNVYPVDDPLLDWRYLPNSELKEGRILYRYNNFGFRDSSRAIQKPLDVKRVIVLGDSVTEGYGVPWDSVFSSHIQSALGSQFEVITIAAGGLNTPQEVHLLEKEGLRYDPDILILNFVLNDIDFYTNYQGARRYNALVDSQIGLLNIPIHPRIKQFLKSSALIYFVKERVENLKGRILGQEETDYFTRLWTNQDNRQKVIKGFDRLQAIQEERQLTVVVIVWPVLTDFTDYRFKWIHEWVKTEAVKRGFSTVDLLKAFRSVPYRKLQLTAEDPVHPNAMGHKIAAEAYLRSSAQAGRAL